MSQVSTQLEGSTAILSLDGRTDLNLLGLELFQSLNDALDEVAADANIKTIILRGAGKQAFSAGVDLREARELTAPSVEEFIRTCTRPSARSFHCGCRSSPPSTVPAWAAHWN